MNRLKDELERSNKALDNAAEWLAKKESDNKREIMKMKKVHTEQYQSMEKEIERVLC